MAGIGLLPRPCVQIQAGDVEFSWTFFTCLVSISTTSDHSLGHCESQQRPCQGNPGTRSRCQSTNCMMTHFFRHCLRSQPSQAQELSECNGS